MEEILTPQYRIEDFWYAIANGLSCPHTPIYRIEQYLAYLCGADVEIPQPIYRIEQYLAYKCGLDVELPEPIYRQEMFLAKWCGMDVEVPTPIYRIEVLLSQLSNGYLHTETGNPISVSDALARPAESLVIEILPSQDLHGYSNPWPAGGGKNLLPPVLNGDQSSITTNDVTLTIVNQKFHLNGTATSNGGRNILRSKTLTLKAGTYKLVGNAIVMLSDTSILSSPFTFTEDTDIYVGFNVVNGTVYNTDVEVAIVRSTDESEWTPYENLCPISGRSSVTAVRDGKNLLAKPFTYFSSTGSTLADCFYLKAGTYKLSLASTDATSFRVGLRMFDKDGNALSSAEYKPNTSMYWNGSINGWYWGTDISDVTKINAMTIYADCYARFVFGGGDTSASTVFTDVQLELGSTDTAYEPYTGTTYSISWQDEAGTVYGGELDVTTGVLTVDRAKYVLDGNITASQIGVTPLNGFTQISYVPFISAGKGDGAFVSDRFSFVNITETGFGKCWNNNSTSSPRMFLGLPSTVTTSAEAIQWFSNNPTEIIYYLATPLTYQLTPTQVDMLLGNNVIWNDINGDMTLEYLADGPAEDIDALQILLGNRYVNNGGADEATDREALDILLGGDTR